MVSKLHEVNHSSPLLHSSRSPKKAEENFSAYKESRDSRERGEGGRAKSLRSAGHLFLKENDSVGV